MNMVTTSLKYVYLNVLLDGKVIDEIGVTEQGYWFKEALFQSLDEAKQAAVNYHLAD